MNDLQPKFRALDQLVVPRRLERFDEVAPHVPEPDPPRASSRIAVVVLAFALSIAAIAFSAVVFSRSGGPAITPATTHPARTPSPSSSPTLTPTAPDFVTGNTPPRGALVFAEVQSDSEYDIAFVGPGGTAAIPMTDAWREGLVAGGAAWSPDGSRVAFVVARSGLSQRLYAGGGDMYVMNADGSDLRRLDFAGGADQVTWSPDGTRIAFVRNQGSELCLIRADGSGFRVIDSRRRYYEVPAWSPLGDEIAFQSHVPIGSDRTAIFLVRPDGSHEVRVSPPGGDAGAAYPAWSPDGRMIAYEANNSLVRLDLSTGEIHQLTRCRLPCITDYDPAWSPDGARIAFIRDEEPGAALHLYLLDVSTGRAHRVGPLPDQQWGPSWRPG